MTAVTVTIGRGLADGDTLADRTWRDFQSETRAVVDAVAADVWVDTPYRGAWQDVVEDAHVWLAQTADGADLDGLRDALALLARRFGQDAIGLVIGDAALVAATDALDAGR